MPTFLSLLDYLILLELVDLWRNSAGQHTFTEADHENRQNTLLPRSIASL